ncbi:MAG: TonB family protein [Candidatus Omnitrophota bacterium]
MMKKFLFLALIVGGFFSASFLLAADSNKAIFDSMVEEEIQMVVGELETIKTYSLTRVSITDPNVADVVKAEDDHILMIAKQPGKTLLFIWDSYGKRSLVLRVVGEDLNLIKTRMQELLAESNISGIYTEVNQLEGKVMVSGTIGSDKKESLDKVLERFSESILNLTKEEDINDLVQIDAQISELTSSYTKNMGIEWTSALTFTEALPSGKIDKIKDVFRVGEFSRTTQILGTINALITEGKGRILSKPKLVCVSGKEASFLVGGQIPVSTTTTSSGGNVQENLQYKDYGVNLTVKPTIKDEKIDVELKLEVSDIDSTNAVGNNVAFTTRTAQTQLYLENGQTVILAGLIKYDNGETIKRIPIFSDVPVLGALFRTTNKTPNKETELVISLTPTILTHHKRAAAEQTVTTEDFSVPNEKKADQNVTSALVSPSAASAKTFIPQELIPYVRSIQEKIAQSVVYPEKARQYGWEGTVKLMLHILKDGTLASASVQESSGYDIFDRDAVNAAKNLAPYTVFPSELNLQDITVTIPIVYNLDRS